MVVVLMGVTGSGKTTVGKLLSEQLGWNYVEADDYHPNANVEKMRRGEPLTDADRHPWLERLRLRIDEAVGAGENVVLACSALKESYREILNRSGNSSVKFVYLRGTEELIQHRLASRRGHFMNPSLLHSQFEALEEPTDAIEIDIDASPETIVSAIRRALGL